MVVGRASSTIAEFQQRLEQESGMNLAPYFRQFVYCPDIPRVTSVSYMWKSP